MAIKIIARGGGVYTVDPAGSEPSAHNTPHKAIQEADRRLGAGATEIEIRQELVYVCTRIPDEGIQATPSLLSGSMTARIGDTNVLHFDIDTAGRPDSPWVTAWAGKDVIAQGYGPDVPATRLLDVEMIDLSVTAGWPGESFELGTITLEVTA